MSSIAVLGTGIMGAPIARRLAEAGHRVTAWNRTRDKLAPLEHDGVRIADTPVDAARDAEFVLLMVTDGPACEELLFGAHGIEEAVGQDSVIVVMSSIPMETARAQAKRFRRRGVAYVDAPVSGGEGGAVRGSLTIMAGGDCDSIARVSSWSAALGLLTHVGPVGVGQLVKTANQAIVGVTIGAVAEALLIIKGGGGDAPAALSALQGGFADSAVLRQHGRRMIERQFRPGGRANVQLKDLRTASQLATSLDLIAPFIRTATKAFEQMCADGLGDLDHSALYLQLEGTDGGAGHGAAVDESTGR